MFVSINFWFRPYEFLCLSLSFFDSISSNFVIEKCRFSMVKIVSVLSLIFISENVPKNEFGITSCRSLQSCVNGVCASRKIQIGYPK